MLRMVLEKGSIVIVLLVFVAVMVAILLFTKKVKKSMKYTAMDDMEGHDFEHFCASILCKKGFVDVEVTKASGDYGIDVLAEKDGITYGIQCKCYQDSVGVKAVQEAFAGKEYYDRMVGVVMTNQYFTAPAVEAAKKLKILLWDRGYIDGMMEE